MNNDPAALGLLNSLRDECEALDVVAYRYEVVGLLIDLGDFDAAAASAGDVEDAMRDLGELTLARSVIAAELGHRWGLMSREVTLRELRAIAPRDIRAELDRLHQEMQALVARTEQLRQRATTNANERLVGVTAELTTAKNGAGEFL